MFLSLFLAYRKENLQYLKKCTNIFDKFENIVFNIFVTA
jgi:hypothetical protein